MFLVGACIVEPPPPEYVPESFEGSVAVTAQRPIALVPVVLRLKPGGLAMSASGSISVTTTPAMDGGASVIAIPAGVPQPPAWLLGSSIELPVLTPDERGLPQPCDRSADCDYPYQLLLALDEPADATLNWIVKANMVFPAGTNTDAAAIVLERTDDPVLLTVPPTVSDVVAGTVAVADSGAQDRIVRLRYTGPTPNAWPLRAEAIVHLQRSDRQITPLVQLDLHPDLGSTAPHRRIFARNVGPEMAVLTSPFGGCAAAIPCERHLLLHFYPAPGPIDIDWEVEVRVRDYSTDTAVDATVDIEELTQAEADAIVALPCADRTEAVIDLAARRGIIDLDEEAHQLARLADGEWSKADLGEDAVASLCRSLAPDG